MTRAQAGAEPGRGGDTDIAFLCLARNCAGTLPAFLGMLAALRASGLRCAAFVGENGSHDGTAALLEAAAGRGELTLVPTPFMGAIAGRLERMAAGRQHLKDVLAGSGLEPRLVCVTDLDNVLSRPPTPADFRRAAAKLDRYEAFAVAATSRPWYYDLLAYDDGTDSFDYLLDEIAAQKANPLQYFSFFQQRIFPHRRRLSVDRDILCISAFNGLCLYRGEAFELGSYRDAEYRRCEHLTFNRRIAGALGARMVIDKDLVLATPDDHTVEPFLPFVWNRLVRTVRRRL